MKTLKKNQNDLFTVSTSDLTDIAGFYETMVFDKYDEVECLRTVNLDEALKNHEAMTLQYIDNKNNLADSFDEVKNGSATGFVEITSDYFYYLLNCLPPIYLKNGLMAISEAYDFNIRTFFTQKKGRFFAYLGNIENAYKFLSKI